ncbi:hypothetical protein [Mycobacterium uberis]|uniref:hypothetical protein n=1 Tax=Mycobacterium uberis TaxID=2162698 RepID=UPI00140425F4|nr:hypothetical protein [Mycobacterium uberis]
MQDQNLRDALLDREAEHTEQAGLRVVPLFGVVVAPGEFALDLINYLYRTGRDVVFVSRVIAYGTLWAGIGNDAHRG